ncbi:sensor histidine kinase [Roseateles sp. LYH14W]
MSLERSDAGHEQRRHKLRWFWAPTAVLALSSLLVIQVEPRWGVLGMMVTTLWTLLAAVAFMVRDGMNWAGSGVLGYGTDVRSAGLFASYRKPATLLALAGIYAGLLLVGMLPLLLDGLKPIDAKYLLLVLLFVPAAMPLDFSNWWLARHAGDRPTMRRALGLWLPALLVGQLACWIVLDLLHIGRFGLVRPMHYALAPALGLLYLLVLVVTHQTTLKWQPRVDQANERANTADIARHLAEARLAVLQAQIEPHFLFNTLATVEYLIKSDPDKAGLLLNQLTRYLRLAMPSMRQLSSTLGREFELTDAYLQIAQLRMGGRLAVDVELPDALLTTEFPSLVVQTLVENAIKHGVEPKPGPVRIRVFARQVGAELHVGVQDNGVGLSGVTAPDGGTGLQNIRERLRGLHGERAQLSVVGLAEGGVLATVVVPLKP